MVLTPVDFLGGGVVLGAVEVVVDRQPLGRAAPAGGLQSARAGASGSSAGGVIVGKSSSATERASESVPDRRAPDAIRSLLYCSDA